MRIQALHQMIRDMVVTRRYSLSAITNSLRLPIRRPPSAALQSRMTFHSRIWRIPAMALRPIRLRRALFFL